MRNPRNILDRSRPAAILVDVSASTVGIILAIFAVLCSVGIYWGGFQEEKRAAADSKGVQSKG